MLNPEVVCIHVRLTYLVPNVEHEVVCVRQSSLVPNCEPVSSMCTLIVWSLIVNPEVAYIRQSS